MLYLAGGPKFGSYTLHVSYSTCSICECLRARMAWTQGRVRDVVKCPSALCVQPHTHSLSAMPGLAARLQSGDGVSDPSNEVGPPHSHWTRGELLVKGVRSPEQSPSGETGTVVLQVARRPSVAGRYGAGDPAECTSQYSVGRRPLVLPCRCS